MDHCLEDARSEPALDLLAERRLGQEVVRQEAPPGASTHHPASGVEEFAQRVPALRRILADERQDRG